MSPKQMLAILAVSTALFRASPASAVESSQVPGVARVSLIEGEASYFRRDGDDWTGVAVNAPLVTGDRVFSGDESRTEVQLAPGVYARLAGETELDLVELAPDTTHVQVPLGRASFRVRDDPGEEHVEIDTPAAALVVRRRGVYRVEVAIGGRTVVRVHQGELVAHVGESRHSLGAGDEAVIEGVGNEARWQTVAYAGTDDFDDWEREREARVASATSYQYVSEEIYGGEDLDEYGDWEYRRGYGQVWRPRYVPAGWGPYSTGRWIWVEPWGWTWLDAAAWGWAPFHYGRLVYLDSFWYWAPGPVIASPIYAPALVGWYGYGLSAGVSIGVGFGPALGWVALGWGEPCFPWWGGFGGIRAGAPWWGGWGGPRIVNNVYVDNRRYININARDVKFVNRGVRGGFSTVPVRDFTSGRGGRVPIGRSVRDAYTPIEGRVPIGPSRDSRDAVSPTRRGLAAGARPPREVSRREIARAPGREAVGRTAFAAAGSPGVERGRLGRSRSDLGDGDDPRGASRSAPARGGRDAEVRRSLIAPGPRAPREVGSDGGGREPYVARRPAGERAPLGRTGRTELNGRDGAGADRGGAGRLESSRDARGRTSPGSDWRSGRPTDSRRGAIPRPGEGGDVPERRSLSRSPSASRDRGGEAVGPGAPARPRPEIRRRASPAPYRAPSVAPRRSVERAPSQGPIGRGGSSSGGLGRGAPNPAPAPRAPAIGGAPRQSIGGYGAGSARPSAQIVAPSAPPAGGGVFGSSGVSGRGGFSGFSGRGGTGGGSIGGGSFGGSPQAVGGGMSR